MSVPGVWTWPDPNPASAGSKCGWCNSDAKENASRGEGPHATWCLHFGSAVFVPEEGAEVTGA